jgi:hypothetical protein
MTAWQQAGLRLLPGRVVELHQLRAAKSCRQYNVGDLVAALAAEAAPPLGHVAGDGRHPRSRSRRCAVPDGSCGAVRCPESRRSAATACLPAWRPRARTAAGAVGARNYQITGRPGVRERPPNESSSPQAQPTTPTPASRGRRAGCERTKIRRHCSPSSLPLGMLDDRVRAGEHQGGVTVIESHQVGRLPARTADLDGLACPLRLSHHAGAHVEPVPDGCLPARAHLLVLVSLTACPHPARCPPAGGHAQGVPRLARDSLQPGAAGCWLRHLAARSAG